MRRKIRKRRKRNMTRVLFLIVVLLFTLVLCGISIMFNSLNLKSQSNSFAFNDVMYKTLRDNTKYYLGVGKYAEEKIENGYKEYTNNSTLIFEKNSKKFYIDSSMFTDDEKAKISTKFIHMVRIDKEKYQDLGNSEEFQQNVKNFNNYFNSYKYENGNFLISNGSDENLPVVSIPYQQVSLFMNFLFSEKGIVADTMPEVKLTRELDNTKPMVALTFDDGPSSLHTMDIVNKLKEYNSAATFYVVGKNIKGKKDILDAIVESGSEIGGHSWDHKSLVKVGAAELEKQLFWVKDAVKENTTSQYEITTFRPPYGAINNNVREKSPYPMIMWDVDTLDWKTRSVEKTIEVVENEVKDGSIVLMHDIHEASKEAALILIPKLIEQGYQLVTVSELMEARGIKMEAGKSYFSGKK